MIKGGKVDHGAVILAVEQFAGRGQRNAEWLANPGENLTFSLFWDEVNLSVDQQFKITKFISLALVELLGRFQINAKIKWPNDIYVGNKKIAGILIENQLVGSRINSSVIGIGLNVNQGRFEGLNATSMALQRGCKFVPDEILFAFMEILNDLSDGGERIPLTLDENYMENLYLRDSEAQFFESGLGLFTGKIVGVEEQGRLIVEVEGKERSFDLKEISFVSQNT